MCQPKSAGGRRCAAHLAATRASRQIAMAGSGLALTQVNTAFNALRAEGRNRPEPTTQQYVQFLQRQLNTINNSNLDHTQRERVRGMIRSATEENMPDGSTFYALSRLNNRSRSQSVALRNTITELAPQMGVSRSEAMGEFWRHYQAPAESSMSTETPAGYANSSERVPAGVPTDAATARAINALRHTASNPQVNPNISAERRITRRPVENSFVKEIGYDREDGRLEVVLNAAPGVVHSYHNVPQSTWNEMTASGASVGSLYAYNVRHNPDFEYSNAQEAENDAHARRCTYCGQFRAVSHSCPQSRGQIRQPRVAQPALSTAPQEADNNATLASDDSLPLTPEESQEETTFEEATPEEPTISPLQQAYATPVENRGVSDFSENYGPYREMSEEARSSTTLLGSRGGMAIRGEESIAAVVNNGDVVKTRLDICGTTENGRYGNDVTVGVLLYRDEDGWQMKVDDDARFTCDEHYNQRSCLHRDQVRADASTLAKIVRSVVDPNEETPAERVRPSFSLRFAERRPLVSVMFPNRAVDAEDDATGFPHRFVDAGSSYDSEADTLTTADPATVRSTLNVGDAVVPVRWAGHRRTDSLPEHLQSMGDSRFTVRGTVTLTKDDEGNVSTSSRTLRCTCAQYRDNYHCVHVDYVANQMPRIGADNEATRAHIGQVNQMAQILADRARQSDWANDSEYLERMSARHSAVAVEDSYSQTFASFKSDLSEAEDKIKNGESPLEYVTENATGGMCAPETGRKFGVELEFDLDSNLSYSERAEALENIGRELHEAGLTTTPNQQGYHAAANSGWGSWSFEEDCTVSGEIVSPIMHDTPEHWAQLKQVCEIIRRNGGIATERTGSHVHVSTGSFGDNIEKHAELAQLVNQHEDTVYRLASSPERGNHRPMQWCAPNSGLNINTLDEARSYGTHSFGSGHNLGINFDAATGQNPNRDNVEFRQWDGTLDEKVIQTQVLLSAAMVNAAERTVDSHGLSPLMREPVGSHSTRRQAILGSSRRKLTEEEQIADTSSTRSFFDTLFSDREHKKRATALFAMTKWQRDSSS